MKRLIYLLILFIVCWANGGAQQVMNGKVTIDSVSVANNGRQLFLSMTLDVSKLKVKSDGEVHLSPVIALNADSLYLPQIILAGRGRHYRILRNNITFGEGELYRAGKTKRIHYRAVVPMATWMENANLVLNEDVYGCLCKLKDDSNDLLATFDFSPKTYQPHLVFVAPKAEARKERKLEGQAYIDFPVDKTTIYPDYRRNRTELAKIRATIDSVRLDNDITINSVWLKGYASPESPYSHNRDLAIGRTEALKQYIRNYYHFDSRLISTDYEPEDWDGLRRFVETWDVPTRNGMLEIINNTSREPDNREWVLKSTYREEYRYLLHNVYPGLRHTDYRITYTIRGYNDVAEIRDVLAKRPQNLSLNEFYLLAQEYEPGSEEFADLFETAVRMYPDDEIANLNAANVALRRGELDRAKRYLDKAGNSREAVYARGIYEVINKNYDKALTLMQEASDAGLRQADNATAEIELLKASNR